MPGAATLNPAGRARAFVETPTTNLTGVVDETGTVCIDRTCLKCGYNLRGLDRSGRCPECATPVGLSIHGDLLCYAEPGYVNKLARGSRWIMRGLTIGILCFVLLIVGTIIASVSGLSSAVADMLVAVGAALLVLGFLAGCLLFLLGVWFITARPPYVFDTGRQDRNRRLVRIYMLLTFLGIALSVIVEELGPPPRVMATFEILALGFSVLGVVGTAAYFLYLSALAARVWDADLGSGSKDVGVARSLAYWFAVVLAIATLLEAIETVIAWGPVLVDTGAPVPDPNSLGLGGSAAAGIPAWSLVQNCLGGIVGLTLLVLFLRAVRLHHRLRKAFTQQATLAAQHWGQAPVPVARPIDDPAPP